MTDFRCKSHAVYSETGNPYGNRYHYGSDHPMDAMLTPHYFMSKRFDFRAGDRINVNRHQTNDQNSRLLEYAELLVIENGDSLDFQITVQPTQTKPRQSEVVAEPEPKKVKKAA